MYFFLNQLDRYRILNTILYDMIQNSIKISKYSRMNGSNLSLYLLNDSFNFVPSSPRFITYYEPVSFSYRFHRRANFFEASISHYSTRSLPNDWSLFFLNVSIFHSLFPRSWSFLRTRSFVRVIRYSRAAICHAQIQEFAPRSPRARKKST